MTDLQRRIAELTPEQRERLERRLATAAATRGTRPADPIRPRDRSRPAPLAFQQEREWAMGQFRSANNIPGAFRVAGQLDLALFSQVVTEVVERHEVLRSTVDIQADGTRIQVVHPIRPVPTAVTDLSDRSPTEQRDEVLRRRLAEATRPFDRSEPLRLRTALLRMGEDSHVVLVTTDHAAADLVSVAILVKELATLYAIRRGHRDGELPPLAIQYADFAAWQRESGEQRLVAEVEHWRQTLAGFAGPLVLPSDRPFPARPTFAGASHFVEVPPLFLAELSRCLERERAALGAVLLAAASVLVSRYVGQDDLVIGELVTGRGRDELEPVIGCFATALPLRMRLADEQSLREVVQTANRTVLTAHDHQDLPIDRLIDALDLGREASQTSMSHLWIDVRTPESSFEVPGLRISAEPIGVNVAAAPLALHAFRDSERLQLQWTYMTEMFDADTVALFAEQFDAVLGQIVTAPGTTVGRVRLSGASSAGPGGASSAGPGGVAEPRRDDREPGFVELFRRRVDLAPLAPAVIRDGVATSYADLARAARRLAHRLRALGVGPETRVGVLVDRSARLAVAILGVLEAGGVFVPLDPDYPADRIAFMLADAGAAVLVTERRLAAVLSDAGGPVPAETVLLDHDQDTTDPDTADPDNDVAQGALAAPDPTSLAYVVYTSGSTGRPKGTMIEHRSLVRFAHEVMERFALGAGDRFLQFASPSFDVLIEELFPTWLAGGAVVIPPGHIVSGQVDLVDLVERERLTVMELPTAYWHEWVRELDRQGRRLPDCLRLVVIGGERVLPDRLIRWRRLGVALLHVYGLTETTVSSTFFRLDPAGPERAWPNLPIGTPLPSADLRILDHRLRPVPVGAHGELYLGGISLARGYLGRAGLTALRFVADPARSGERLYRTGDRVRQRPDGNLEFIARVDTQIKIRGFRVEPMEIESTLSRHPDVAECVVSSHEPTPGDRRLVAYVVAQPGADVRPGELRRYLEPVLPAHLVPSAFVALPALPLNHNGKVDRDRLPAPDGLLPDEDYVAPETPLQQRLADIVAAVVGVVRVGLHDNFFELGGDSILAIQVVARAREAGLRLSPYDLFAQPTTAGLATVVAAGPVVDAEQGDVSGPVPVAPTQHWFCVAGLADPGHWNTSVLVELPGRGDPELLAAATEHLLAHHDGLRQRILLAGDRTRVRIAPRGDATPFTVHEVLAPSTVVTEAGQSTVVSGAGQSTVEQMAAVAAELQGGLDLAVGPLFRVGLVRFDPTGPDRLAVVAHRLVADPASLRILVEDLGTALAQLSDGRPVVLPRKTTSWQSWVRRLVGYGKSAAVQDERRYWSDLIAGPTAALPVDRFVGPDADIMATAGVVKVALRPAETTDLLAAATALSCRVDELVLTALARTLSGWTGAARHLIDLEPPDQPAIFDDVDLSRTVGWFSHPYPVGLTGAATDPADAALKAVKEALHSVPAGGIGWPLLRTGPEPLPPAPTELVFSYLGDALNVSTGRLTVHPGPVGEDVSPRSRRAHAIAVRASVEAGALVLRWEYSEARHDRSTIQARAEHQLAELRALADLGRRPAGALHTPSDFPLARVDQSRLDDLLSQL